MEGEKPAEEAIALLSAPAPEWSGTPGPLSGKPVSYSQRPPAPIPLNQPADDVNYRSGEEALRRGDYERAVSEFTRCVLSNPSFTGAFARRAEAWKALGRYDSAAADLTHVLQIHPTDERAAAGRGQLLSFNGRYREASDDYSAAIQQNATNPSHYLGRGQAYSRLSEFPAAVADFSRAIDLAPGNAVAYLERGTALLQCDRGLGSRGVGLEPGDPAQSLPRFGLLPTGGSPR